MRSQERHTRSMSSSSAVLVDAIAGVAGSLVALWTFYPLDVYKIRKQAGIRASPRSNQSNMPMMSLLYRLFAGIYTKSLHTTASSFCYFYLYSTILSLYDKQSKSKNLSSTTRLALTCVAAALNTLITLPLDTISAQHQTRDQETAQLCLRLHDHKYTKTQSGCGTEDGDDEEDLAGIDNNNQAYLPPNNLGPRIWHRLTESKRLDLFRSYWKGLHPSLLLCINPAIHYTCYENLKGFVLKGHARHGDKSHLSMIESFMLGMVTKFVATLVTYPLIRAKVLLMVLEPYRYQSHSTWQCLQGEYNEKGLAGLYQGCHLQLTHTLLKSALLMMVRERMQLLIRNAMSSDINPPTTGSAED